MTEKQASEGKSSPGLGSALLRFQVPEVEDVEVYIIKLEDGTIVARTAAELAREKPAEQGIM